jgi:hypothetical protein
MEPISVGQCRSVNKHLLRLSYDKVLLRKFPHYVLNSEVYFKEEAYHSKELFLELMKRDTNDLEWLVPRTTSIIKECQMDSMSWALLTCARATGWDPATWDATWTAAQDGAVYAAMYAAWETARNALAFTENDIIKLVHVLGITDPQDVGDKFYQMAECKSLLVINKKLCLAIMAIAENYNLPKSIQISKGKIELLRGNFWIQQYVELYQGGKNEK